MEASDLRRVRELEAENAKLKRMYAELALDNAAMKDLIACRFTCRSIPTPCGRLISCSMRWPAAAGAAN